MTKQNKAQKVSFKEILVEEINGYMDKAFETTDPDKREKYREIIREMEKLLITIAEIKK